MLKSVAGRRVPFNPEQFPTRLSRRVGLRTMGSIGAKKPCPSGEQITNGGFETGDFTDWTVVDAPWSRPWEHERSAEVVDYSPKEGTYHTRLWHEYGNPATSISQDLTNPVPQVCLVATSIFRLYLAGTYNVCGDFGNTATVRITYTDDTFTDISWEAPDEAWHELNLKPYVESGKTVKNVKISFDQDWGHIAVDGVSLIC